MIFFQMFSAAKVVLFCELRKFFRYFFKTSSDINELLFNFASEALKSLPSAEIL